MRRQRRAADGFNLSFLDVMACGLGAVILIFILVDFNAFTVSPSEERQRLEAELEATKVESEQLGLSIEALNQAIARQQAATEQTKLSTQTSKQEQSKLLQDISNELAVIADLEDQVAALSKQVETPANIKLVGQAEQNYITGMKVEGDRIGILIDKSASMMGDNLLDVLGRLALADSQKQSSPKWLRTQRVARWLAARLPMQSNVTMVTFSDNAKRLGSKSGIRVADNKALTAMVNELNAVVPDGGTNLQLGLAKLFAADPRITDVYLVTDGLPTLGEGLPLACKSLMGSRKTISSDCRQSLFVETVNRAKQGVRYNVILLPIDGDPYAPSLYWDWSRSSGGTFLSPTARWP